MLTHSLTLAYLHLGGTKISKLMGSFAKPKDKVYICISVCGMYLFVCIYFSKNIMFSVYLYVPKCTSKLSDIVYIVPMEPDHLQRHLLLHLHT